MARKDFRVKTYVVLQRHNLPKADGDNVTVKGVFLTSGKAEELRDALPGTFIEKHTASK